MSNRFDEMMAQFIANGGSKPRKAPSDEEHRIQVACVHWFAIQYPKLRGRLFAVPNGGHRNKATASLLKAEGVTAGVADLILLKRNSRFGALLIEMKTPVGKQSATQKEWEKTVCEDDEYKYVVCHSIDEFVTSVNDYLNE